MLFNVDYTQIAFTTLRLNYKDFNLAVDGAQISSLYGMLEDNTEKLGLYLHSLLCCYGTHSHSIQHIN